MNDICPFCNSEARIINYAYVCDFCSDYLNIEVWWWVSSVRCDIDYIGFGYLDNFIAGYNIKTQELVLQDETRLTIPTNQVLNKLQTILLLS